ncbi:MAG: hypothetical protein AB1630_10415 [bacterium]
MNKYKEIINSKSMSKEDLQKGIKFFEYDNFSYPPPSGFWVFIPIMIFLIFLIILKQGVYVWVCVILHLFLCFLIAFWLGRKYYIESRLVFFLKHIEKYLPLKDLQDQWLSQTFTGHFFRELFVIPYRYMLKRECVDWRTGEVIISLKFFILYSLPVFLPIIIFYNESVKIIRQTEGYFILYPLLLLYITWYFSYFTSFLFWKKLKKELLEMEV